jgi:hypothetical protein
MLLFLVEKRADLEKPNAFGFTPISHVNSIRHIISATSIAV